MSDQGIPAAEGFDHRRQTASAEETAALGAAFARRLRGGEVILLYGPLGAGKTCFVQGLCRGLDVTEEVTSPTFTLVNSYTGRLAVHHLDFYRIEPEADLGDIGVEEILDEVAAGAVLVAEWPEPLSELVPDRLELLALPGATPDIRDWYLRRVGRPSFAGDGFPDVPVDDPSSPEGGESSC